MTPSRLVPEVVQTSAMDCGPACLAAVLEGFGIPVAYGPLRDACQTDVDGTSIDSVEELASRVGLVAEQMMVPLDHLLLSEASMLPAIVVVRSPSGFTHFVVVWSVAGPFVQVMDPAVGRRWVSRERFLADVFIHSQPVSADAWYEWTESEEFRDALRARLRRVGAADLMERLLDASANWSDVARLDAAVRYTGELVSGGALRRGAAAVRAIEALCRGTETRGLDAWSAVRAGTRDGEGPPHVVLRGAVLVRIRQRSPAVPRPSPDELGPELRAALEGRPPSPLRELVRMLRADGWLRLSVTLGGLALVTVGVLAEALVLRAVVDIGAYVSLPQQRWALAGALLLLVCLLLALELPIAWTILGVGRRLEVRFRTAVLQRIIALGDRYFTTRPLSDMAERTHAMHQLRAVGEAAWSLCRATLELLVVATALTLLWRPGWPLVVALGAASLALPLAANVPLRERDLRARTHLGALSRFYLDALLGLVPVRAHAAERALQREHESLLVEWVHASRRRLSLTLATDAAQLGLTFAMGAWLIGRYLAQASAPGGVLLLAYWTFRVPVLGEEIGLAMRRYPVLRSLVVRLIEPLTATTDEPTNGLDHVQPAVKRQRAVSIQLAAARVVAAGNVILDDINLSIAPRSHVAIVGQSGAGKSTLLALLLGWRRPTSGDLLIDGAALTPSHLDDVRRRTAWVDPSVQLWNESLLENLLYGVDPSALDRIPAGIEAGDLRPVLARLPNGMATSLGEGGSLVSGGEGQRVRLARVFVRGLADLVVLDEPFRGLDRQQRSAALERIRRHFHTATLLLATHDIGATMGFERVVVMEGGRIVEDGQPAHLAAMPSSRYAQMLSAERDLAKHFWRSGTWRRIHLDRGRLEGVTADKASGLPRGTSLELTSRIVS